MKCYFHPDKDAVGSDSVVDLERSMGRSSDPVYKRIHLCFACVLERRMVATSRIQIEPHLETCARCAAKWECRCQAGTLNGPVGGMLCPGCYKQETNLELIQAQWWAPA